MDIIKFIRKVIMLEFKRINIVTGSNQQKELVINNYLKENNIDNITVINHPENGLPCEFIIKYMEDIISNELLTSNNNLIFITESPYIVRTIQIISSYLHLAQERKYFQITSDNIIIESDCTNTYKRLHRLFQDLENYDIEYGTNKVLDKVLDTLIDRGYNTNK